MKNRLKILEDLAAYHSDMLSHLRAMIAAERGQSATQKEDNGATQSDKPFPELTKAKAVAQMLSKKGEMHVNKIFSSMKRRGHPVKSKNSLSNLLSTDKRFEKRGKGIWALSAATEKKEV